MAKEDDLNAVWYAGHRDGTVTVIQGLQESPLPHRVKHSPTGFGWGYGGSGPADLARSMLIHALGEQARCKVCEGTGQLVYVPKADRHMPIAEAEADYTGWDPNDTVSCWECEDGVAVIPAMYQQFKFDVIAKLPQDPNESSGARWLPWSIPQAEVLAWWSRHQLKAVPDE